MAVYIFKHFDIFYVYIDICLYIYKVVKYHMCVCSNSKIYLGWMNVCEARSFGESEETFEHTKTMTITQYFDFAVID